MEKYDLQLIISSGHMDLKRAVLGFAAATAAAATGQKTVIFLTMDGIEWATDCRWLYEKLPEYKSIKEYIDSFLEAKGRMEVCTSCLESPQSAGGAPLHSSCVEEYHLAGLTEVVVRMNTTRTVVF